MAFDAHTLRLLDTFALRTRRSFYGLRQGSHRSQRRGHGVEFAEYRSYELGDNPRYIDWNLYARSDKIYVKRYLEEETVSMFVVVDGSRSLTHTALQTKWHAAAHLASCISYVALAAHDPVTLSILGGPHSPAFWGSRAFASLTDFLDGAGAQLISETPQQIDLPETARRISTRVRFPGICVIISDFLSPLSDVAAMLSSFRARNMEIHAVQILGDSDIDPAPGAEGGTLVDSETGQPLGVSLDAASRDQYQELMTQHTHALRAHCLAAQIQFVSARIQPSLADTSIHILNQMGLFI
jgi:uncharacterized protein (DUF58 family)